MLKLDLLRHGETELSHTLRGSTDDALTATGWQQMFDAVNQATTQQWDVIMSSPLQRCALFAEKINLQLKLPLWIESDLQEMHFGEWEAQTTQWIYDHHPEELAQFWQMPTLYTPPQGEGLLDFHHRVTHAIDGMTAKMQQQNFQNALIITHGGVIKLLKTIAQQEPLDSLLSMQAELGKLNTFHCDLMSHQLMMDDQT